MLGALRRFFGVAISVMRFALKRLPPSPGIYAGAGDFARAVLEGRSPAVSAEEGRRIVALMEPISQRADEEAAQVFAARFARLEPADVLVDSMRGRFTTWTRIRVNLQNVPEAERPAQELHAGRQQEGG